jgi:hypothetical protein
MSHGVVGRPVRFADGVVNFRNFLGLIGTPPEGVADTIGGHSFLKLRIQRP